jgi:hypothetical protein
MHTRLGLALALTATLLASAAGCSDDEEDTSLTTSSASSGAGASTSSGASGGDGGASVGTGGAGGAGGGPTGTGGAGGGSAGAGGEGGAAPCTWSAQNGACGAGNYCDAPACGAGTCKPIADLTTEEPDKAPVCGCDGATYWNASVAASHGMAVSAAGECVAAKTCGGFGNLQCPPTPAGQLSCNMSGPDASVCLVSDQGGGCWGMPASCPVRVIGPTTRACGGVSCEGECELIKQGTTFYEDVSCPQ